MWHLFQGHLRRMTDSDTDHVSDADLHFVPGVNVFREMRRCVGESAVFVAVMSANYCDSYHCQLEISEARTTGKPIILIFKEHVAEEKNGRGHDRRVSEKCTRKNRSRRGRLSNVSTLGAFVQGNHWTYEDT